MKKSHILIVALISLIFGFGVSWMVYDSQPVKLEAGLWFGEQAKTLPEFELIDHNGQILSKARFRDRWSLIFFGYTHCPDVCPTTLQDLSDMMKAIQHDEVRRALQVVFVSVDPDRDSAEILKKYVQYFNPDFIGATAALPEIDRLTDAIGIMHSREKTSEDQVVYGVSHSASVLLLNPLAEFAGLFRAPHDSLAMANDLGKIINNN
jgi:protein SCO1/2